MAARRLRLGAVALGVAASALALTLWACGSAALDAFAAGDAGSQDGSSSFDATYGEAGATAIEVNALLVVHAARFPAFRVCFDQLLDQRPTPDSEVMPDSNVVGVDIGTAIRLPPLSGTLGKAYVYQEPTLRPLYPAGGGPDNGPTCRDLLQATQIPSATVGEVTEDLAYGVHALVLQGCQSQALDPGASIERCGDDWTLADGNLALVTKPFTAYQRLAGVDGFPMQLVQLSPSLASASAGHALGLRFGAIGDAGDDSGTSMLVAEGVAPLGVAVPTPPAILSFRPDDLPTYATSGLTVSIDGLVDDAGLPLDESDGGDGGDAASPQTVLTQSLAQIQQRSASNSIPPEWFAIASSYVVLSIGEIDPRLADGGPDPDERRALHLLAVPLAAPDAGSDASP